MARRTDRNRLRFLPQHLALEGYLALHFGGPAVSWDEWSRQAVRNGLSPRCEEAYTGAAVRGLADALRVFEIHQGQCGLLLYVADALAGAFVVPHPDDYRALHPTLLHDLYGELLFQYSVIAGPVRPERAVIEDPVSSLAEVRAGLAAARAREAALSTGLMAGGLLGAEGLTFERVYRMGRFTLERFLPVLDPRAENHIGETITDEAGRLAYLKTFRLSAAQTRRGYLLKQLAAAGWNLDAAATALGTGRDGLITRMDRAGLGHLLAGHVLDAWRARARRR
jgi:hypothetical protein